MNNYNEGTSFTRRDFNLKRKVLLKDSKVVGKLINAWDVENDSEKVLKIFINEKDNLSSQRYWEMLRTVWIISGSNKNQEIFRKLFLCKKPNKYCFSTPEEAKELRDLPKEIDVYRACNRGDEDGFSWTFSMKYAVKYQDMFDKEKVISRTILKSKIFALINRNDEHEILII